MIRNKFGALALLVAMIPVAVSATGKSPKYVFFIVGDGMGIAQRQIAELYKRKTTNDSSAQLLMNTFPVSGINLTHSADNIVTDSAAAASALATGYKVNNRSISILPDGQKPKSLLVSAMENGWSTGVISTDAITNATPAAFIVHNKSRKNMNEIAEDIAISGVDFIAGGGYSHFVDKDGNLPSAREDNNDLVDVMESRGYRTFVGKDDFTDFKSLNSEGIGKVFAAFSPGDMPFEIDRAMTNSRIPSLSEITQKAIDVLYSHQKPFFLMIETEGTDTSSHLHDSHALIKEILELDRVVKTAYEFYKRHPKDTLIIVTADHETGGLGLGHSKRHHLDLSAIMKTKMSSKRAFSDFESRDIDTIKAFSKANFGLDNMTEKEESILAKAIEKEIAENKKYRNAGMRPIARAVADIVSARSGVNWTSVKHTAAPVILTAVGIGSERFGGYLDNTQVSKNLANLLGLKLSEIVLTH